MTNLKNNQNKVEEAHIEPDQTTNKVNIPNELLNLSTSINGIIESIETFEDLNTQSSEEIYNELLELDLWELLRIKANLEKADKVNFLVDEDKFLCIFRIDKDIREQLTNMIIIIITLLGVLISIKRDINLALIVLAFVAMLSLLMGYFTQKNNNYTFKPTNNKYKVFQYLVDIAIENKKKELN